MQVTTCSQSCASCSTGNAARSDDSVSQSSGEWHVQNPRNDADSASYPTTSCAPSGEPQRRTHTFPRLLRFILLTATRRNEAARISRAEIAGSDGRSPQHPQVETGFPVAAVRGRRCELARAPVIGRKDGFVFTTDGRKPIADSQNLRPPFDLECGVSGWTIHDLRRTARTLMSRADAIRITQSGLTGTWCRRTGTYDVYAYRDEKLKVFEALADQIGR